MKYGVAEGDRVEAWRAVGGRMRERIIGEVTEIEPEWPLPTFDGAVAFVTNSNETVPVRMENVELLEDDN